MDGNEDICLTVERSRKIYLRIWLFLVGAVFCTLIIIFLALGAHIEVLGSLLFLLGTLLLGLALTGSFFALKKRYRTKSKAVFLDKIAKNMGLSYHPNGAFEVRTLSHHGILPPFDQALSEDGFSRETERFPLSFQEVRLRKTEYDQEAKTHKKLQQFRGLVILIKLRQRLNFHTVLLPNKFLRPNTDVGTIAATGGMEKVNIVSPKFAKEYSLYADDQIESRTVFDPIFIERFLELGQHIGSKWMEASFKENELLIAAHFNQNFFELRGLFHSVREEDFQRVAEEIQHVLAISDILKHNMYLTAH